MNDIHGFLLQGLTTMLLVGVTTLTPRRKRLRNDPSLCDAASVGDRRQLAKLLANGVDPNSADEEGTTALMAAVFAGQVDAARHLLEAGADPDAQDVSGMTALMNAVIASSELELGSTPAIFLEIVQLLLDHGADTNLEDEDGSTALDHAESLDLVDLVELIELSAG